jgi:hypothetical protein
MTEGVGKASPVRARLTLLGGSTTLTALLTASNQEGL